MILNRLPKHQVGSYKKLLKGSASVGRLFTDTNIPVIPPRGAEKVFGNAFNARMVGGDDTSIDAIIARIGIGIKTFRNDSSKQKIAEFNNQDLYPFSNDFKKLAYQVSEYRNRRIEETVKRYEIDNNELYYHYTTRHPKCIQIHECAMEKVNINQLTIENIDSNRVLFSDGKSNYTFYQSKSVLMKKFDVSNPIIELKYDFLNKSVKTRKNIDYLFDKLLNNNREEVILPLYGKNFKVWPSSGLNQWNAKGRKRHIDEVYIPIPRSIHLTYPDFFPKRDIPFELITDTGKKVNVKVCQAGGKALMSKPNKDLGQWILREKLNAPKKTLITMNHLIEANIDSVLVTKQANKKFTISVTQSIKPGQQKFF